MSAVSIFMIVIGILAFALLFWLFYVLFYSGKEE